MNDDPLSSRRDSGLRWLVSGRVQRVGFRVSTRRQAVRLGLSGHARNLPDGRVEVVAAGAPEALRALRDWLEKGPALARVDRVEDAGEHAVTPGVFSTG